MQRFAIARVTRSWNGLLVAVCRSRLLGSSSYAERVPLAVRRSRSLGSSSYAEPAPRGPPVLIARVQLLRRAVAPPTWPRSLGTRQRGTASPRPASIAQDSSSRGQLRRATGRLLACPHLGTHHLCREPAANRGLPLLAAPRESPPGPVPVPGDKEISSGRSPRPTRAFRQHFPRVSASTGQSTGGARLSPGNPRVVHRVIHRYIHSHPPDRPPSGHRPRRRHRRRRSRLTPVVRPRVAPPCRAPPCGQS